MKSFTLKDYKAFSDEALVAPPLDSEEECINTEQWEIDHKVHIFANNCVIELDWCADTINGIDDLLKNLYDEEYYSIAENTSIKEDKKITSKTLLEMYLDRRCRKYDTAEIWDDSHDMFLYNLFKDIMRITVHDTALSDCVEVIRIENDLRPSETRCLYDDFESGELYKTVKEIIAKYVSRYTEKLYDQGLDLSTLCSYVATEESQGGLVILPYASYGGFSDSDFKFFTTDYANRVIEKIEKELNQEDGYND